jgi:broad specificity phosphatase PhoE
MTQPLKIFYVRHGETEWSLSGQHTGTTDIPLTAKGEDDARALAPWMRAYHFDHVYTSPRQRARHTCELAGLGAASHGRTRPVRMELRRVRRHTHRRHPQATARLGYLDRRLSGR